MRILLLFLFIAFCLTTSAQADIEKEKRVLLDQHEAGKLAHLRRDADALVRDNADTLIYVGNGAISYALKRDSQKMFKDYLDGAEYSQYEDLHPPIVRISDDGTMAWMITRTAVKRVKRTGGQSREESFTYAGIMTYKKVDGSWIREANVSTFEPRK